MLCIWIDEQYYTLKFKIVHVVPVYNIILKFDITLTGDNKTLISIVKVPIILQW